MGPWRPNRRDWLKGEPLEPRAYPITFDCGSTRRRRPARAQRRTNHQVMKLVCPGLVEPTGNPLSGSLGGYLVVPELYDVFIGVVNVERRAITVGTPTAYRTTSFLWLERTGGGHTDAQL